MRFSQRTFLILVACLLGINIILAAFILLRYFPANTSRDTPLTKWDSPLEQHFATIIDELGPEKAYAVFKQETAKTDLNIQHTTAHIFGTVLYKKVGIKGVTVCDNAFAFGCYHSYFAQAISDKGINSIQELDNECLKKFGEKGLGCAHGIGHGVIYFLGKNHLNEALTQCTRLSWKGPVGGCTSGVFMEFNLNTMNNPSGNSKGIRPFVITKRHSPCMEVSEQFRRACYFEMPQWWVMTFGGDTSAFEKAGAFCHEIAVENERNTCLMGLGNVAGPTSRFNVSKVQTFCRTIQDLDGRMFCQAGAAWSFRNDEHFQNLSSSLCDHLPDQNKKKCLSLSTSFL